MYAHFYQLAENPFNLTPDPKFHYVNESTREAMASILHGLKARKGFLALIGEAGTGKTTLLKRIVDEIEGEAQVVFVFNPGVSFEELLEFICSELGVVTDGRRRLHMLERLNEYLLDQLTAGRNVVVMIDEAQTLSDSVLEELRLLSNLETSKEKILQILLSGQPELEEKLRRPGLRQLRQRIAVRATLKPMHAGEIGAYVYTRLKSAGSIREDLFTNAALHKVWRVSKGIPRVVNVVCDNAMMIAFAEGKKRISYAVTVEAVRDLEGEGRFAAWVELVREWLHVPWVRYVGAGVLAVAVSIPVTHWLETPKAGEPVVKSPQAVAGKSEQKVATGSARIPAGRVQVDEATPRQRPSPVASEIVPEDEHSIPAGLPITPRRAEHRVAGRQLVTERIADPEGGQRVEGGLEASGKAPPPVVVNDAVRASIRRAEMLARATAARLFETRNMEVTDRDRDLGGTRLAKVPIARFGSMAAGESEPIAEPSDDAEWGSLRPVPPSSVVDQGNRADGIPTDGPRAIAPEGLVGGESQHITRGREVSVPEPPTVESVVRVPSEAVAREHYRDNDRTASLVPRTPENSPRSNEPDSLSPPDPVVVPGMLAGGGDKPGSASFEETVTAPGVARDGIAVLLGRLVEVKRGDTVWDIAIDQYGTAGPKTLKRILANNPGVRDPRRLEVGTRVYLPFVRPEQMIKRDPDGSFGVIVSSAPDAASMETVKAWAIRVIPGMQVRTEPESATGGGYRLIATGFRSRDEARKLAEALLDAHGRPLDSTDPKRQAGGSSQRS